MKSPFIRVSTGVVVWLLLSLLSRGVAASLRDPSFRLDPRVTGRIDMLAVQPGGKILAAGVFTNFTPTQQAVLLRIEADGTLDTSFQPWIETSQPNEYWGTFARISDVLILSDGRIVVGRAVYPFLAGLGDWHTEVRILSSDGKVVGSHIWSGILRLAVDSADRVIAAGWTANFVGAGVASTVAIRRYSHEGAIDSSFRAPPELLGTFSSVSVRVVDVKVAKNGDSLLPGKLLVGFPTSPTPDTCAVRLQPDGSLIWKYGTLPGQGETGFIAEAETGMIIIGRTSGYVVEHLTAEGNSTASFTLPVFGNLVATSGLLLEPDGRLLIPGRFSAIKAIPRMGLAALRADGTVDPHFDPGIGFTDAFKEVTSVARQSDGKILVGGSFSSFDGIRQPWLVRLFPRNPEDHHSLVVKRTGSDVEISWPDTASGFALETAATLETEANWQPSSACITQENGLLKATLPASDSARFFRLRK
jgi:uncharacterized delta-60 repeat protein